MIDPALAVGAVLPDRAVSWTSSDVLLYQVALGIGSGRAPSLGAPGEPRALAYVHEPITQVLPTFGVMPVRLHATEPLSYDYPGVRVDPSMVLHGSQEITAHVPLPADASGVLSTRVPAVYDKGSAAVLVEESEIRAADGGVLATARSRLFLRGEGGFGGDRGPAREPEPSFDDRAVRRVVVPTAAGQALLYRLCGDRNPLHSDPDFARRAGFDAPILHGLCTWGMVCHALVDTFLEGDASSVLSYGARFAGVVRPGDELLVEALDRGDDVVARVSVPARAAFVLDDVRLVRR